MGVALAYTGALARATHVERTDERDEQHSDDLSSAGRNRYELAQV